MMTLFPTAMNLAAIAACQADGRQLKARFPQIPGEQHHPLLPESVQN
jgi:hypothetical protein